jgi:hypothetical protein
MLEQYTLERYVIAAYRSYFKFGNCGPPLIDQVFIILIDMWETLGNLSSTTQIYSALKKRSIEIGRISMSDVADILSEYKMCYMTLNEEEMSNSQNILIGAWN